MHYAIDEGAYDDDHKQWQWQKRERISESWRPPDAGYPKRPARDALPIQKHGVHYKNKAERD